FPSPLRGYVEMEGVSFSYCEAAPVLDSIDLKLEPGEKVALVGMSGSGKSTVVKLVARLYDMHRGGRLHRRDGRSKSPPREPANQGLLPLAGCRAFRSNVEGESAARKPLGVGKGTSSRPRNCRYEGIAQKPAKGLGHACGPERQRAVGR